MPALISKPLKPFTWNNNKFQINQAFKDEMQERETSEIVVVACVGEARVGKSTLGNTFVAWLRSRKFLANSDQEGLHSSPVSIFQTGDQMTPVTAGIDCVILDLVNGKTLLWFDMEGVNNRDRPELSMLLAILTQITNHLIFIDKSLNDTLRSSLGRIVGSRMIMIQGQNVTWPRLNIALSASRLRVNDETLTAAFAPGDNFTEQESQDINNAFPTDRRTIAKFPDAGRLLDNLLFQEVENTPYGEAVDQWLESTLGVRDMIQTPLMNQEVNAPHTGGSFIAFLEETLRSTNLNIASGQLVIQLPSGLVGMVTARCDQAREQCLKNFHAGPAGRATNSSNITGQESASTLESTFRTQGEVPCLAEFDSSLGGFSSYPIVQTRRQELISTLRGFLQQAESLRCSRAEAHHRAQEVAAANARLELVVAVVEETRAITATGAKRWREIGRKTRWHKLSRRDTVTENEDAEYIVEVRDKRTQGNGRVSYTDWVEKGRQWRETGAQRSYHP